MRRELIVVVSFQAKWQMLLMIRQILSLLLSIALFSAVGQSAASAAQGPMPAGNMAMSMADCMNMMQSASDQYHGPSKHKGCTPADCLNYMVACSGMALALPDTVPSAVRSYIANSIVTLNVTVPLRGRSPPPDIQPPII